MSITGILSEESGHAMIWHVRHCVVYHSYQDNRRVVVSWVENIVYEWCTTGKGLSTIQTLIHHQLPDSKVHVANMEPIWGRQDPDGPHVGPTNFAIWDILSSGKLIGRFCKCVILSSYSCQGSHCFVTFVHKIHLFDRLNRVTCYFDISLSEIVIPKQ